LDKLEVHIPAAKQTLQSIQAKNETGQKISDKDNQVCLIQKLIRKLLL